MADFNADIFGPSPNEAEQSAIQVNCIPLGASFKTPVRHLLT